ncbi:MAG: 50S ribosomal protein L4 [Clostridia bacterium 62_21]|nr:MAG: 50S ribosomal protein L4 [Clostridia bacterium 62_21]
MPKVAVYNTQGEQVGEIDLKDEIFGAPVNEAVLHEVMVMYRANRRRGTHDTKTRAEVAGGGRKPWRQKGTGRARHGSIRSPIWRGGGIVFGPHPRDYGYQVPKKVRRLALKSALSSRVREGKLLVLDRLELDAPRTKEMVRILDNLQIKDSALVVTGEKNENVVKSARNLPGIMSTEASLLNAYDILRHGTVVMTRDAVARVEEVLAG